MPQYSRPIQNLMDQLAKLPGIGQRSAERMAFHLLKQSADEALLLADAIREVKTRIKNCSICYNLTESDPCDICCAEGRDHGLVCVVEQPKDLLALESAGSYQGVYHVLLGRIAPLDDTQVMDTTIDKLLDRLATAPIKEVILGTNPNVDGDTTAIHLIEHIRVQFPHVRLSRLARGIAAGTNIEFANKNVLADALAHRREVDGG
jgi:recombination protein RecR